MPVLKLRDLAGAIRQAVLLTVLSLVLTAALWAVRSDRLPLRADPQVYLIDLPVPLMATDQASAVYAAGSHFFVDTRPGEPADRATVPGSFVIREQEFDADVAALDGFLFPEDALVLFGADHPLPVAAVAARLQARGFENLVILQGGFAAWQREGLPVTEPSAAP